MTQEDEKKIKVKSLYKALSILDYFCEGDSAELSVTEISEKSGLLMSTVHNILSTFAVKGFVQKSPNSNKYALGKKFLEFANAYNRNNPVQSILRKSMQKLSNLTGETVFLAVPYDINIIYIDAIFPANSTATANIIGVTAPMYCTAIGKAILSKSSQKLIDEVLKSPKMSFTENTITDEEQLKKEIELIQKQGYAVDNMEHEYGIKCVGVAIDINHQIYGLSISGPSLRFSEEKIRHYAKLLKEVSAEIM
ncbi:MAG TPA: IclR family transcriptional regulator [Clostridia bacterium]